MKGEDLGQEWSAALPIIPPVQPRDRGTGAAHDLDAAERYRLYVVRAAARRRLEECVERRPVVAGIEEGKHEAQQLRLLHRAGLVRLHHLDQRPERFVDELVVGEAGHGGRG